ncbi:MAG: hypothetical protein IPN32_12795 [Deltaproteobacteria bacterium]|nr:hypothetical protein [Deltaproteobacteria bacterium]
MSSTDPTSTTDPTVGPTTDPTTSSTTDPTVGTDTDPTAGTDTDPTAGGGFDPPPAFGTNVLDLDLVGVWGLNWDQPNGFDSVLDVDDQGNFMWTETSADCSTTTLASGFLWVDNGQIVMHVETWERPLPWDTQPALGETFPPPFRLRMGFSLQGSGPDDYLALAGPPTLTETAPYTGESYIRLASDGAYIGGNWHSEAQLEAIPAGETSPVVIVRDTYQALLDAETDGTPNGTGACAR